MLSINNLFFGYKNTNILKDISLELHKGEILSIVGPNGTGKTSLLKCITGIHKPDCGTIMINGQDLCKMHRRNRAKSVGYVPQNSPSKFPITVFDVVLMGRRPYMTWRPLNEDLKKVAYIIESMNLKEFALRDFDQLSGGQKQKVLLARAVAQDTDYLLLDEPTSSLDLKHQLEVLELLSSLVTENNAAVMLAMHDLNLASRFSHRIVMLNKGQIICSGTPQQVMKTENIRSVYGVEAIIKQNNGYPYVLPTGTAG
ncbi:MAG: ABC transporter ATP-binding protein [Proteobacteria bacterium]|nr:ABC transporter ATP-binding protein [Pseudomonadota bacterium]MBU1388983.1 ABC transporter ATP-binding protein [Pseudomonadota bacterium]MBU1543535.1 ABC transporter ATP-binding protein [Pseudomonadota bacterium]MBU2480805.1 ABC transporter ATP-binding protein [Pseudomonadota bacterium]